MEFIDTNLNTLTDILLFTNGNRPLLRRSAWVAITFFVYMLGFNLLSKFAKECIIHEAVPKINQHRLKIALWRIVFSLWAIVFYLTSVWELNEGNLVRVVSQASAAPQYNITNLNSLKQNIYLELALLTAPVSFFLHQIYISISSFMEPAVISMGGMSLFVCLCYYFCCQKFCLQVLFLLGLNVGTLEVARIVYALKSRYKGFHGPPAHPFLQYVALPAFILHLLTWMLINFYLFPKMYFSLPSAIEIEPSLRTATVYINLFLVFYAKVQFFDSPAWSLMKLVVKRPSTLGRVCGLKSIPMVVLLPYSSSLLPELKNIQIRFLMNALPTSAERRIIRKKILSGESQTSAPISKGTADLFSVIKCVKMLKRKMRNRYEQKTANEAANTSQNSLEDNDKEDCAETSAGSSHSQEEDVNDIFISVPSLPESMSNGSNERSTSEHEITADVHLSSLNGETEASDTNESNQAEAAPQRLNKQQRRHSEEENGSQD